MRQKIKIAIFAAATVAMLVIIFIFSNQPGDMSGEMSSRFLEWILVTRLGVLVEGFGRLTGFDIRKDAHMFLYLLLGICAAMMFRSIVVYRHSVLGKIHDWRKRMYPLYAFIFCVAAAAFDECHQLFIPGRAGLFRDVCIDGIGFTAAIIIVFLCDCIILKVRCLTSNCGRN